MIVVRTLAAPATLPAGTYMALVELEVGYTCCHCREEISPGAHAVFVAEPDKPVRFAHLRSVCPRPAPRAVLTPRP